LRELAEGGEGDLDSLDCSVEAGRAGNGAELGLYAVEVSEEIGGSGGGCLLDLGSLVGEDHEGEGIGESGAILLKKLSDAIAHDADELGVGVDRVEEEVDLDGWLVGGLLDGLEGEDVSRGSIVEDGEIGFSESSDGLWVVAAGDSHIEGDGVREFHSLLLLFGFGGGLLSEKRQSEKERESDAESKFHRSLEIY